MKSTTMANKRVESREMVIAKTGIRSGEWIMGATKATLNTVMQIVFNDSLITMYPPDNSYVADMSDLDIRDKLNNIEFFKNKTFDERKQWLEQHGSDNFYYLNDIPNVMIRLCSVGGDKIISLENPNLYDDLMDGELHSLDEFFLRIPGGEKTRRTELSVIGGRHSLSLRGSQWKLKPVSLYKTPDVVFSLVPDVPTDEKQVAFQCAVCNGMVAEMRMQNTPVFKRHNWKNLALYESALEEWIPFYTKLEEEMKWFTPSIHKSMIQKLIRTRCVQVRLFNGELVPAPAVVFASFVMLVTNKGSFVPDIRRFVRGSESAFKRVGVALAEDSYSSCETITSMLAAALVAQNHPEFEPTEQLVAYAIQQTIIAQSEPRAWDYETVVRANRQASDVKWRYPHYLLEQLGSFQTDIGLMQSIGLNPTKLVKGWESKQAMEIMKIEYCLDQHSLTNIAYFFPCKPNSSYTDLFQHLWIRGTGRNARKTNINETADAEIETAQRLLWMSKSANKCEFPMCSDLIVHTDYHLDWSWMAGMLEKIQVKVNSVAVDVFAHPDTPGRFVAIRPATRDRAAEDLTDELKEQAIEQAKLLLSTEGKKVSNKLIGISGMAYYREFNDGNGKFTVLQTGKTKSKSWDDLCNATLTVSVAETLPFTDFVSCCEQVFRYTNAERGAVTENWKQHIHNVVQQMSAETLARLQMYVRPLKSCIELHRISRDGSSTYLTTSWKDTAVFQTLMYISAFAPGVLFPDSSLKFHIYDFRIWSVIRAIIMSCNDSTVYSDKWHAFNDERVLYAHQTAAVEQITHRMTTGRRGNLIWIPVGLGKTLIVCSVIGWMIQTHRMPEYCVYSLPPSAVDSVKQEFERGGLPVNIVKYTGKSRDNLFQKHCVNMIEHDNMRVASNDLLLLAPNCMFIVDEFHLTMNDTKRTSIALEMAKLSHNFIGLTGTLIKDKSSKGVIEWVSQVVEFEVNEKNYWVAIAALVSRKIALPIKQERLFHEVCMNDAEKNKYLDTIDAKFGGRAVNSNFHSATKLCYSVVERGIIELTLSLTNNTHKPIFVVAKDNRMQMTLQTAFEMAGKRVYSISTNNSITLTPNDEHLYDVVITTCKHSTGFTLTQADTMVTSVYFSNQATRDQLEGRILRMGQTSPTVTVYILHTGILTYTLKHYEDARSLRQSMEDLAEAV